MAEIASEPLLFFGGIAALIFLGFAGNLIFSKLRFNDTILLIGLGVLLGPVTGAIPVESLQRASTIVGPLALILILFDGGLALKFRDLLHGLGQAASLAVGGFVLATGAIGGIVAWALQVPLMTGLILGAILGGTSALVVLPSLKHMRVDRETSTILGLESAITDVLVVVVAFTLVSIVELGQGPAAQDIASKLIITFAMSIFIGVAMGFLWLWMMPYVRDKPYGYMLTLGVMFFLYVAVEWLLQDVSNGGGPLSVLAFGVVLGNVGSLGDAIRRRVGKQFGAGIKKFQGEISFIVRTFFFIYLGILVDLDLLRDVYTWALALLLLAAMVLVRYVSVATLHRSPKLIGGAAVMVVMMPRGLAAAVLAAVPAQREIPGTERFVALAFLSLILTNLLATVGAIVLEKRPMDPRSVAARQAAAERKRDQRRAQKAERRAARRAAAKETKAARAGKSAGGYTADADDGEKAAGSPRRKDPKKK